MTQKSAASILTCALIACMVACDDGTGPPLETGLEVGVVVGSTDRTLTLFYADSVADPVTIGLGPDGSPVNVAVRAGHAVVPMGVVPSAAIVNLADQRVRAHAPLPEGSGATGVAFLNDSIAIVGNPARNSVTPINVRRGTAGQEIAVGVYPQAATAVTDTVFVLNANLVNFAPAGPASVSVITGSPPQVVATITLSGTNAGAAVAGPDGRLYVLQSGSFGGNDGALSIIDRRTLTEIQYVAGFGDFPGGLAVDDNRRVYVGGFGFGLAVWDAIGNTFLHPPASALRPGGVASVSGVALDSQGRVWSLRPDCEAPGSAYRLNAGHGVEREVPVGICPFAIAFGRLP